MYFLPENEQETKTNHTYSCDCVLVRVCGIWAWPLNFAAMLDLFTEVSSNSPYEVQFDALPIGFLENSTKRQQQNSLQRHAEKRALAEMLTRGCESLEIGVNFHMCVDCHAFFKGALRIMGNG